jgi:hypothetical protein
MVDAKTIKKAAAKDPWLPLFMHHLLGSQGTRGQSLEERIVAQLIHDGINLTLHFRPFDEWASTHEAAPKLQTQTVAHYLVEEKTSKPQLLTGPGTLHDAVANELSGDHAQAIVEYKKSRGNRVLLTVYYFAEPE